MLDLSKGPLMEKQKSVYFITLSLMLTDAILLFRCTRSAFYVR